MTLSDLERRDASGQTFLEDLRNYGPTVRPRTTKFTMVTLVGMGVILGVRHPPHLMEQDPASRKFL